MGRRTERRNGFAGMCHRHQATRENDIASPKRRPSHCPWGEFCAGAKTARPSFSPAASPSPKRTGTVTSLIGRSPLTAYSVFNVEQIDGLPDSYYAPPAKVVDPTERIERANRFFRNTGALIRHGGNQAYYSPVMDYIQMPPFEAFRAPHSERTDPIRNRKCRNPYLR